MPAKRTAGAVPGSLKRRTRTDVCPSSRERNGYVERQQLEFVDDDRTRLFCVACCDGSSSLPNTPLDEQVCQRGHTAWYATDQLVVDMKERRRKRAVAREEQAEPTPAPEPTPVVSTADVGADARPAGACRCGRALEDEGRKTCRKCRARAAAYHEKRKAAKA